MATCWSSEIISGFGALAISCKSATSPRFLIRLPSPLGCAAFMELGSMILSGATRLPCFFWLYQQGMPRSFLDLPCSRSHKWRCFGASEGLQGYHVAYWLPHSLAPLLSKMHSRVKMVQ